MEKVVFKLVFEGFLEAEMRRQGWREQSKQIQRRIHLCSGHEGKKPQLRFLG